MKLKITNFLINFLSNLGRKLNDIRDRIYYGSSAVVKYKNRFFELVDYHSERTYNDNLYKPFYVKDEDIVTYNHYTDLPKEGNKDLAYLINFSRNIYYWNGREYKMIY